MESMPYGVMGIVFNTQNSMSFNPISFCILYRASFSYEGDVEQIPVPFAGVTPIENDAGRYATYVH